MAKFLPLPKTLKECDQRTLQSFIETVERTFPSDLSLEGQNKSLKEPATTFDGKYHWATNKDLFIYITDLTETGDIRSADAVLYQTLSSSPEYETPTMTGAPEYPVSKTSLTPEESKQLTEELEKKEAERKRAVAKSDEAVRTAIKRKQEIYTQQVAKAEALKKRLEEQKEKSEVYVKVEEKPQPTHPEEQQRKKEEFVNEIGKDPRAAIKKTSEIIESRIKDIPPEAAEIAAEELVLSVQDRYFPQVQAAVTEASKKIPEVSAMAESISVQEKAKKEVADMVVSWAFGDEFKNEFLPDVKVDVSETPAPDYQPMSLAYIPYRFAETAKDNAAILEKPNIARPDWATPWVEKQIAMATEGIQGSGSFDSGIVQGYFVTYSQAPQFDVSWEGLSEGSPNIANNLDLATGTGGSFALVGNLAGGVAKKAAAKAIAKATTKVATQIGTQVATQTAAKAGGTGAGAAIGAALGIGGGPLAIITAAIGAVISWVASKINWKKLKEYSAYIIGGLAALIALPFVGLGAAIGVGLGTTVISFGLGAAAGGLTAAGIGGWIVNFLGAVASATLGAIGIPILVTLLGFPVVVAIILFIINSGAYIVPPSALTSSLGRGLVVQCTSAQGPVGVPGPTSSSPIANRAWEIVSDLYQGFWCYWNKSPDYPDLFDMGAYSRNPNPPESSGPNLFWCTYLVIKSYRETGHNIPADLGVAAMKNHWPANKIISAKNATPQNIVPGSAVFFGVPANGPGLQHVGIVYSVDPGGIVVVESNNAVKSESINFNPGGGVGSLPGMYVDSFGLP